MSQVNALIARDSLDTFRRLNEATAALLDRRLRNAKDEPVPDREADEVLVGVVATVLRAQLCARRVKGLAGWHAEPGRNEALRAELSSHVACGSMVDAIRVAAMIHAREHLFGGQA
ncbi:MAG: hypothetical protein AB7P08_17170 [Burkholderiales bacterium]